MIYRPRNRIFTPSAFTGQIVSLAEMKEHLRVSHMDEDGLIKGIEAAAVARIERWTQRLLAARSVVLRLPGGPCDLDPVELPGGTVQGITSVTIDAATITGAVAVGDAPALLVPSVAWPVTVAEGFPTVITYVAGYATGFVPADLVAAIKLIAGHLFENRSAVVMDTTVAAVPLAAEWLMSDYRIKAI